MKCFVIMPFAKPFNDVYALIKSAVETAVSGEPLMCRRLDEIKSAGRITDDLLVELQTSDICIADITGSNPNVMWEVGYAMALHKPTVFISQSIDALPFDLKDLRVIGYNREDLYGTLRLPVAEAVRDTLARYEVPRERLRLRRAPVVGEYAIAITGSSKADPAKAARRLRDVLHPFLGSGVLWYCGSSGAADEAVLRFLIEAGERTIVVGYHQWDISQPVLELMEKHDLHFIDSQQESLIGGIEAPSSRDLFFAARANLVILLWNGKSRGVGRVIDWFKSHTRDYLLVFV
jgi:hypothetical protein